MVQKEENDNQKNLEEQKIKMLKYENDKLKKRIKDIDNKNYTYSEELERLKSQRQNQIDKNISKKDNEIRRYKSQIVELKLEINKLQKKLDEKNSISNNMINSKKIKINKPNFNTNIFNKIINKNNTNNTNTNNTGNEKSLRKTDSDFFLTSQKIILTDNKKMNNEKIVINSKNINNDNKKEEKDNEKQNYSEKNDLLSQSKEKEEQKEDLQYIIERDIKNETKYDKSIKIILLGDSNVGKSSIINRLCKGKFKERIGATASIEYHNYLIKINDYTIRMKIWDTVGQEKYNSIVTNYYHSTDYGIFVYSIDDFQSFYSLKDWLIEAQQNNTETFNEMKYILLGNKKV